MAVKEWLNERPGAAAIEAEEDAKRVALPAKPFDPRTEVSADARFIVTRLVFWLLGVPLLVAGLIYAVIIAR